MLGGALMSMRIDWIFFVGGAAALSAVLTFLGVLSHNYGTRALTEW